MDIAAEYQRWPWQYFAETTPRQRLVLRLHAYAKSYKQKLAREYYERHPEEARR